MSARRRPKRAAQVASATPRAKREKTSGKRKPVAAAARAQGAGVRKPRAKTLRRVKERRAAKHAATKSAAQLPSPTPPGIASASNQPAALPVADLNALREQLEARLADAMPARWNPEPEEVRRAVMKLVLTIAEFVRQLLERQAVRRMEAQTLTPEQVEAVGLALMRLEEAVHDLAKQSGLDPAELNLDLGPLGRLL